MGRPALASSSRRSSRAALTRPVPRGSVPAMDHERDATRRTLLANERTFLAWWRGGLTSLAVSLGAGALVPQLTSASRWPFALLGIGFGILAITFIAYGSHRHRVVEEALARGEFAPLQHRVVMALGAYGVILGLLTILAVLIQI